MDYLKEILKLVTAGNWQFLATDIFNAEKKIPPKTSPVKALKKQDNSAKLKRKYLIVRYKAFKMQLFHHLICYQG